jgi:hypothetical protein
MIYYILQDFRVIPQDSDLREEPASWVFEVRPLIDKCPPEIHISRADIGYSPIQAADIVNHLRESRARIGDISQIAMEKGVIPAMERLVLHLSRRRETVFPKFIEDASKIRY